jgi:hypothetical protein
MLFSLLALLILAVVLCRRPTAAFVRREQKEVVSLVMGCEVGSTIAPQ